MKRSLVNERRSIYQDVVMSARLYCREEVYEGLSLEERNSI